MIWKDLVCPFWNTFLKDGLLQGSVGYLRLIYKTIHKCVFMISAFTVSSVRVFLSSDHRSLIKENGFLMAALETGTASEN